MAKVAWLTDIHLNFVDPDRQAGFYQSILDSAPDAVLVGGDIAEGPDVCRFLRQMESALEIPIYFVLGNHDFYRSSIGHVRRQVADVASGSKRLVYLSQSKAVHLSETTALVGHDGWGDARLGDYERSEVVLSDFFAIAELADVQWDHQMLRERLVALGQEAAEHLRAVLPEAMDACRRVVVLTHVPPFAEAAWHRGSPSNADWLPFFSCRAVGDALREAADARPDREMLVLCGHTHGGGEVSIRDNLRVLTGAADYGRPRIAGVLEFA